MKKQLDSSVDAFIQRHLSQLRLVARVVENEVSMAKPGQPVTLDRELAENLLDTLEIFIEDIQSRSDAKRDGAPADKPAVTRLN